MNKFITKFLSLSAFLFASSALAQQTQMVCVSWMDHKTEIQESDISEYATAHIDFTQGDWSYSADMIEGKLNFLTVNYLPLKLSTTSRSLEYPLNHIANAIEIDGNQASVDCDLR